MSWETKPNANLVIYLSWKSDKSAESKPLTYQGWLKGTALVYTLLDSKNSLKCNIDYVYSVHTGYYPKGRWNSFKASYLFISMYLHKWFTALQFASVYLRNTAVLTPVLFSAQTPAVHSPAQLLLQLSTILMSFSLFYCLSQPAIHTAVTKLIPRSQEQHTPVPKSNLCPDPITTLTEARVLRDTWARGPKGMQEGLTGGSARQIGWRGLGAPGVVAATTRPMKAAVGQELCRDSAAMAACGGHFSPLTRSSSHGICPAESHALCVPSWPLQPQGAMRLPRQTCSHPGPGLQGVPEWSASAWGEQQAQLWELRIGQMWTENIRQLIRTDPGDSSSTLMVISRYRY